MASEAEFDDTKCVVKLSDSTAHPSEAVPLVHAFSDWKDLEYVSPVDPNLICPICQSPFLEPVKLRCDHVFCTDCLNRSMVTQEDFSASPCPSCRRLFYPRIPDAIQQAPRILRHILDDLIVNCPAMSKGCQEEMARGLVHDHVTKYCNFTDCQCPDQDCSVPCLRKDFAQGRCLHARIQCQDCLIPFMEQDMELHCTKFCDVAPLTCQCCGLKIMRYQTEKHVEECPEFIFKCEAAPYGCDFRGKRLELNLHLKSCLLVKLAPFLKLQNDRLEAHMIALDHLAAKNNILQTGLFNVSETLETQMKPVDAGDSSAVGSGAQSFEATTHHLLCVQESLRRDVERVSVEISQLDARASMMILNESLRVKDEMAHTNAAVNGMRTQLHYLTIANQQRNLPTRPPPPTERTQPDTTVAVGESSRSVSKHPVRRLSDPSRQETKL